VGGSLPVASAVVVIGPGFEPVGQKGRRSSGGRSAACGAGQQCR
jgi:hypothetical protein